MNAPDLSADEKFQREKLAQIQQESCYDCVYSQFYSAQPIPQSAEDQAAGAAPIWVLTGFCRRRAPVPLPMPELQQRQSPIIRGGQNGGAEKAQVAIQPKVMPSYSPTNSGQWCGDHETVEEYLLRKRTASAALAAFVSGQTEQGGEADGAQS